MGDLAPLAEALRAEPPKAFAALSDPELARFTATVVDARRRRSEMTHQAIEDALGHLPRPLRRPVRAVLGVR